MAFRTPRILAAAVLPGDPQARTLSKPLARAPAVRLRTAPATGPTSPKAPVPRAGGVGTHSPWLQGATVPGPGRGLQRRAGKGMAGGEGCRFVAGSALGWLHPRFHVAGQWCPRHRLRQAGDVMSDVMSNDIPADAWAGANGWHPSCLLLTAALRKESSYPLGRAGGDRGPWCLSVLIPAHQH